MTAIMVTGAANGIGRATARAMAAAGHDLVLLDRDRATLQEVAGELGATTGRDVLTLSLDVADPASVARAFAATDAARVALHGLVHCAGVVGTTSLADTTVEEWQRIVSINLTGSFLVVREAAARLSAGDAVVLLASMAAQTTSRHASPAYAASKAGVIGLTKSLSASLAERGVRINAIAPGAVDTGMLQQFGAEQADRLRSANPMRRLGTPDEIAAIATFLVSDASSFLTGQTIAPNGGAFVGG